MRFGVSARRLEGQRLGIGRYIEYMLKSWEEMLAPADRMTLYLRAPLVEGDQWISDAFETRVLRPRLTGITWENLVLGPHARDLDVLFCPSYTVPLTYRGRCVVATHSLSEVQTGTHPGWRERIFRKLYQMSAEKADMVIVPSRSVLRDVREYFDIPAEKIAVVHEGAPDSFQPIEDEEVLRATRREYIGEDRPYILFVGKFSQRRNIPLLVQAFADLKKREKIPHSLLLMGPNHLNLPLEQLVRDLGITDSVIITNRAFANHRDLIPLYSAADLYAFPSAYEGASNTVVEAMASGLPVVAGNCEAIADIVDGCGVLLDQLTVEALSEAMGRVLTDRAVWKDLRAKGLERSRSYRWSHTARHTFEIMQQVAGG